MHSKMSILVAAFLAAAAYASPMGGTGSGSPASSSYSNGNAPYPTTTTSSGSGSYSMTTSYGEPSGGYYTSASNSSAHQTSSYGSGYGSSTILGVATASPNPSPVPGLVGKLLTDDTTVDRFADIQSQLDAGLISLKFDFNPAANPGVKAGDGGQVDLANRKNFPLLTGQGISAAGIFFQPCGLNTPHIHPRATEFLTLVTDTNMLTGFVLENNLSTEFNTTLTQFQGTVFPMGSIHFQQNLDCEPAVAIAGLNSDDPGASSIAQNFIINLDPDVVDATLGFPKQIDANNFAQFKEHIPLSLAKGVEECFNRCHMSY
ncbi:hypothetical protein ABEF92_003891 [Exophiala dermatitidis]|uniref:Cupin type-1 domain-containing protein n=1 Tax=Exophiala dermatitidis (strain ATCC 34100 / CBS 525.76 / NIH/UT8656) TaxID=858893 RepID=H6BRC4_EXODN|nr:uncharacterized protein HMPREF1120_02870 [Exophiala dermatitidis NIH/UT8656]EHY54705.1 hypothetical protein HMPREF1120_02870 [Exophiala dermatitidis NIH/UT8656]